MRKAGKGKEEKTHLFVGCTEAGLEGVHSALQFRVFAALPLQLREHFRHVEIRGLSRHQRVEEARATGGVRRHQTGVASARRRPVAVGRRSGVAVLKGKNAGLHLERQGGPEFVHGLRRRPQAVLIVKLLRPRLE